MSQSARIGRQVVLRSHVPSWTEKVSRETWLRVGVLAALLLLVYWGEVRRLVFNEWTKDDWTHGYLIPVMSLYIVHLNRERLWRIPVRPSLLGVPVILLASCMYLWSIIHMFGYFRASSILIMLAGVVMLMGGWRLALAVWFPIFLLIFSIPLPDRYFSEMTMPLRQVATVLSTGTLNLLPGVSAVAQATVIDYTRQLASGGLVSGRLNVEEACSGMRLLMAFLAMGAIMAYLMREKPLWHRIALLALCVPIAIFCNYIRVTITGVFQVYGYANLAKGGAHAALGLLMMVLALALFSGTSWVLSSLVLDAGDEPGEEVHDAIQ